jgi:hypothetical protein
MRTKQSIFESDSTGHTSRAGVEVARGPTRPGTPVPVQRIASWIVVAFVLAPLGVAAWLVLFEGGSGPSQPASSPPHQPTSTIGVSAQVSIGDSGGLFIVETLTFPTPQDHLDLYVPQLAGVGKAFRPVVDRLAVRDPATGTVPGPLTAGDTAGIRLRLAAPATRVVLEYTARGVVQRSDNRSAPERALALVTPLMVRQAQELPATVGVDSVKVLNVGCDRAGELIGCGTRTSDGWTVETNGVGPQPAVFAQINLATP